MISRNKAAETYAALNRISDGAALKGTVKIHVSDKDGNSVGIMDLFEGYQIGGGVEEDSFLNKSLNTAKEIFSKLAAGNVDYKIAKIAFGNAGHSISNPKVAVPATEDDTTLQSLIAIKTSLENTDSNVWFLRDENGVNHRMVYIEKDILPEHISYGENGNQFIVRVPISYDEFNMHQGADPTDELQPYVLDLISYKYIKDGVEYLVGDVDPATGDATNGADFTEVKIGDDGSGNVTYRFRNGYAPDGSIDVTDGGIRPQEISEILLTTDVITDGSVKKKLAASRMTSGLLSFPEGFQFTYEWTLTWNFSQ